MKISTPLLLLCTLSFAACGSSSSSEPTDASSDSTGDSSAPGADAGDASQDSTADTATRTPSYAKRFFTVSTEGLSVYAPDGEGLIRVAMRREVNGGAGSRVTVDPSGKYVWISHPGTDSYERIGLDPLTFSRKSTSGLSASYPISNLLFDATGKTVYVSVNKKLNANTVDESTGDLVSFGPTPVTGPSPTGLALHPNGRFLYLVDSADNTLRGYTVSSTGELGSFLSGFPITLADNSNLKDIAVSPRGDLVAVPLPNTSTFALFHVDETTGLLTEVPGSPFNCEERPVAVTFSPDGSYLYIANQLSSSISIVDVTNSQQPKAVDGSPVAVGSPAGMTFDPTGRTKPLRGGCVR